MILSQNDMGRAFEYSIAMTFQRYLPATIVNSLQMLKAKQCFETCSPSEQEKMVKASSEAVAFLVAHDDRLSEKGCLVSLQSDQMGTLGDVRDVIVHNSNIDQDLGISAKNRHWAVKHSRLSEHIDFGSEWFGIRCSAGYFHQVTPIFRELNSRRSHGEKWHDIPNKKQLYYMPILQAFQSEMQNLFNTKPQEVAKGLVKYLLGKYDYYKVIKENGTVSIMSFNIDGTLKWGSKIPLPTSIINISQKPKSETTLFMYFDKGWQISFRIHNASTMVEPSLKFDINIVGLPSTLSRQVINYG
ncbi:MAG: HaeIII family restriction endonuclease [Sphaerochaetaceae bacterium]